MMWLRTTSNFRGAHSEVVRFFFTVWMLTQRGCRAEKAAGGHDVQGF